jgi:hypothetical protein
VHHADGIEYHDAGKKKVQVPLATAEKRAAGVSPARSPTL